MNKKELRLLTFAEFCLKIKTYFASYYSAKVSIKNEVFQAEGESVSLIVERDGYQISKFPFLEGLYNRYCKGMPYMQILEDLILSYEMTCKPVSEKNKIKDDTIIDIKNFEAMKESIIFDFVNKSKKTLSQVPYVDFVDDIAIIFRGCVDKNDLTKGTFVINNSLINIWNQQQEPYKMFLNKLYRIAYENTQKIVAFTIEDMDEVIIKEQKQHLKNMEIYLSDLHIDKYLKDNYLKCPVKMFVLTNQNKIFNATGVLYTELLDNAAKIMKSDDFYVVLKSCDDAIFVSAEDCNKNSITLNDLKFIIEEINFVEVEKESILSSEIFHYDSITKRFSRVS